jgi:prepilin-type processing-associated H-X9-DG protein
MFDFQWASPIRKISDGTANTIAIGEGAGGPAWPAADFANGSTPADQRNKPHAVAQANMHWINAMPAFSNAADGLGVYLFSTMACTLEPINKTPVTKGWANEAVITTLPGCNKSLPSAPGTPPEARITCRVPAQCSTHVAPNFRSDHPGGCNFLFADGSVHFLNEDINMLTYQQLSTMMGGEVAEIPGE